MSTRSVSGRRANNYHSARLTQIVALLRFVAPVHHADHRVPGQSGGHQHDGRLLAVGHHFHLGGFDFLFDRRSHVVVVADVFKYTAETPLRRLRAGGEGTRDPDEARRQRTAAAARHASTSCCDERADTGRLNTRWTRVVFIARRRDGGGGGVTTTAAAVHLERARLSYVQISLFLAVTAFQGCLKSRRTY